MRVIWVDHAAPRLDAGTSRQARLADREDATFSVDTTEKAV
jgi:hypothetical protein